MRADGGLIGTPHQTAGHDYARCDTPGCAAARFDSSRCLEHIGDRELFDTAAELSASEGSLDARGATITSKRLERLLIALNAGIVRSGPPPQVPDRPTATVSGAAFFEHATFVGPASFASVCFEGPVYFDGAEFRDEASFDHATFSAHADFDNVRFRGPASFVRATFDDHCGFEWATFDDAACFNAGRFRSYADFDMASFMADAEFRTATFQLAHQLGPLAVDGNLVLNDCVFGARASVEVAARAFFARGAIFADGVRLSVHRADVALDTADFARPSTLSRAATWPDFEARSKERTSRHCDRQPRLITLRGAQVAQLSLSDVDLRACCFFGAHGLHSLDIEPSCRWPHTPPQARWAHRETIAEEHHWRGGKWRDPAVDAPEWLTTRHDYTELQPGQIAALYRGLRKAREDGKDQAGASDLYYGEMEMRRLAKASVRGGRGRIRSGTDTAVITAYWMLSGYGLKASRAFASLLVLLAIISFGMREWGFTPDPSLGRAALYSVESSSSLVRRPVAAGHRLTPAGETMQVVTRTFSPVLIALGLLALRARVKR